MAGLFGLAEISKFLIKHRGFGTRWLGLGPALAPGHEKQAFLLKFDGFGTRKPELNHRQTRETLIGGRRKRWFFN